MTRWQRFRFWLWWKSRKLVGLWRLLIWYLRGKKGLRPWVWKREWNGEIEYHTSVRHSVYDDDGNILHDAEGGNCGGSQRTVE